MGFIYHLLKPAPELVLTVSPPLISFLIFPQELADGSLTCSYMHGIDGRIFFRNVCMDTDLILLPTPQTSLLHFSHPLFLFLYFPRNRLTGPLDAKYAISIGPVPDKVAYFSTERNQSLTFNYWRFVFVSLMV